MGSVSAEGRNGSIELVGLFPEPEAVSPEPSPIEPVDCRVGVAGTSLEGRNFSVSVGVTVAGVSPSVPSEFPGGSVGVSELPVLPVVGCPAADGPLKYDSAGEP